MDRVRSVFKIRTVSVGILIQRLTLDQGNIYIQEKGHAVKFEKWNILSIKS